MISIIRPKQWLKNLLVFAVPVLSGDIFNIQAITTSVGLFIIFSLSSSTVYVVNDIADAELDREHLRKRLRPVASGEMSKSFAKFLSISLFLLWFTLGLLLLNSKTFLLIVSYFIIQISYSFYLKRIAVLELLLVASGFVFRAISGGTASGIYISTWFLIVISFTALFMVSGKRFNEARAYESRGNTRSVLRDYKVEYLRAVWVISLSVSLIFYALWSSELFQENNSVSSQISTVLFCLLLLKYGQLIENGDAEAPEDVLTKNAFILVTVLCWITSMLVHVYGNL